MDLADLRAGNTFEADANCPTCRVQVPYVNGEREREGWRDWQAGRQIDGERDGEGRHEQQTLARSLARSSLPLKIPVKIDVVSLFYVLVLLLQAG